MAKWIVLALVFCCSVGLVNGQDSNSQKKVEPPTIKPAELKPRAVQAPPPTREEIQQTLLQISKDGTDLARATALVTQLGDEDFSQREMAMQELKGTPWLLHAWRISLEKPAKTQLVSRSPFQLLEASNAGAKQADEESLLATLAPEIKWRLQMLLPQSDLAMEGNVLKLLECVQQQRYSGLVSEILACGPVLHSSKQLLAAGEGIAATATEENRSQIAAAVRSPLATTRYLGLMGLSKLATADDKLQILHPAMQDAEEWIRLAAARVVTCSGEQIGLKTLAGLLDSESEEIRSEAFCVLYAVTGRDFGYLPTAKAETRAKSIQQWQVWTSGAGQSFALQLPMRRLPREKGLLLLCDVAGKRILELDSMGSIVWEKKLEDTPWACQGLPNGHRLVCSSEASVVFELNSAGDEVWRSKELPKGPMSVQRLPNGNTLVACSWSDLVVEINEEGEQVWWTALEGRPVDAQRLENGNTLVALQNNQKVVEVDVEGKIVWEQGDQGFSFAASRLNNGNTLSCDFRTSIVKEVAPGGKLIWSHQGFVCPIMAQRLRSGNTLVSDKRGVKEISPDGKEIRAWNIPDVFRFCWY